jgi:prefoldin subunit 5
MDTDKAFLVICATLVIVLFINAGIIVSLIRANKSGQFKSLGKAIAAIQNPFNKGNEELNELRQRISQLEKKAQEDTENEHG